MSAAAMTLIALQHVKQVEAGDDLVVVISAALAAQGLQLTDGDILVVSSKIASKAAALSTDATDKTAIVAAESEFVIAERALADRPTRIVKALAGPVMAAAGVDGSNIGSHRTWLLLPRDPDQVCRDLKAGLDARHGVDIGVILSDTAGRAWRIGQIDFALGAAGIRVFDDLRGGVDADGRPLEVTTRAIADELASAADIIKGKVTSIPVALIRGAPDTRPAPGEALLGGRDLVRDTRDDWFGYGRVEAVRAALGVEPGSDAALEIGLASVRRESRSAKVQRAIALALRAVPDAAVDVSGEDAATVTVLADNPYAMGRAIERLSAALWCEWLALDSVPDAFPAGAALSFTSGLRFVFDEPGADAGR